ncbi:hypothetical protein [Parashewanella tropica]|uniref:hypothetical protein n=1 Tax=Parashewanella tropica TaxID=2547970 RepID=UPI00105986BF|nr:hypothetical protein [Parashewanella tropica]
MKRFVWLTILPALLSFNCFAKDLPCGVHNEMKFTTKKGNWLVQVEHLNEIANVVNLDDQCTPINQIEPGTMSVRNSNK